MFFVLLQLIMSIKQVQREELSMEQTLQENTKEITQPKYARRQSTYDTIAGYLFISPMILAMTVLVIIPIMISGVISFTDWNFITGLGNLNFIGLENYKELFVDDNFYRAMKNNLILIAVVPIGMFLSLILAVLINKATYFKTFFKIIYFMPFISSFVAVAVLWRVLYHPSSGPINMFLKAIGIEQPPLWLADPSYALVSVMIIQIWASLGFGLIIYLAGLQSIPSDLYEAADIDGATPIRKFLNITFPLLSPTTFFLMITGIIGSFKIFDLIMVLTNGGPAGSTSVIVHYLYEEAFINLESGYASTIGIALLFFILLITVIQFAGQKKWVNY
jgi:multiple sugar transport system permease protein